MKDVLYYSTLVGHEISDDVVVVGLCPSSNDVRSRHILEAEELDEHRRSIRIRFSQRHS